MISILQNVTGPPPTTQTPNTLLVSNINYALLFLALSCGYMIAAHRKQLFSAKLTDIKGWGNVLHYVAIAVIQALFLTAIQSWLENVTSYTFGDWPMTIILLIVVIGESIYIENH